MLRKTIRAGAAALTAMFAFTAHAQDQCRDVLVKNLADQTKSSDNRSSYDALFHAWCSSFATSNTDASNAGGTFQDYLRKGGANFSSNSGQSYSSENCSKTDRESHLSSALYYSSIVNKHVVEAWRSCMAQHEYFACWAEPDGNPKRLVFIVEWRYLGRRPQVVRSALAIGDQPSREALPKGEELFQGSNFLPVDRNEREPVSLTIQATADNIRARVCRAYVPPISAAARPTTPTPSPPTVLKPAWQATYTPHTFQAGPCPCFAIARSPNTNRPLGSVLNGHDPNPSGAWSRIVNHCARDIEVTGTMDVEIPSIHIMPHTKQAPGRRFLYTLLKPGQTMEVDTSRAVRVLIGPAGC